MARTGYVNSHTAIARLAMVTGDGTEAIRLISEALTLGNLQAKGCQRIYEDFEPYKKRPRKRAGKLMLRNIGSDSVSSRVSDKQDIPPSFWQNASEEDRKSWNLLAGFVFESNSDDGTWFEQLSISERDLNVLINVRQPRPEPGNATKLARARKADWSDWVAALAMLAHEHRITGDLNQADLFALVVAKLGEWDLRAPELSPSTTNPVLRAVRERFASTLPNELKR